MSTPTNEPVRSYWAALVTDFMVGTRVAIQEGEQVPDWVALFVEQNKSFVIANNTQAFLDRKFAYHRGNGGRNGEATGIKAWKVANSSAAPSNPANVL